MDIEYLYEVVPQLSRVFRITGKIGEGFRSKMFSFFNYIHLFIYLQLNNDKKNLITILENISTIHKVYIFT